MSSRWRHPLAVVAQLALLAAGTWFLVAQARDHWSELSRYHLAPDVAPLVLASLVTVLMWFLLIALWVWTLKWWTPPQRLAMGPAVRIWFLTNLARYIPGSVWQFAGLAALVAREGVSAIAATGGALLQRVALTATGAGLTLILMPRLIRSWGVGLGTGLTWGLVLSLAAFGLLLVPATGRTVRRIVIRVAGRDIPWPEPPPRELAVYVSATALPWIVYGVAFWWFGRALLGDAAPSLGLAVGTYTASYVAGLIAIFAPGGIVVREAALVAVLGPAIGHDAALLLAVGSRFWLVALELVTALVVLAWPRKPRVPSPSTP
jgi:hypothetical protein